MTRIIRDKWDDPEIDEFITELRAAKEQMTYEELSDGIGISFPTVVRWVHGAVKPSKKLIELINLKGGVKNADGNRSDNSGDGD